MGDISDNHAEAGHATRLRELRGIALVFLGSACWGFSATCVSFLVDRNQVDVVWLACIRLICAGLIFLVVALVRDRDKFAKIVHDKGLIAQLIGYIITGVLMMQIGYMSAIKYTNAGTALLLLETSIPVILAIQCFRARRRPKAMEFAAILLALAGVTSIATQGNLGSIGINPLGLFWGLFTAAASVGYNIIPVRFARECGPFVLNGIAMTLGGIALLPAARPWAVPMPLDATGWLVFWAIVLVGTVLAYAVYLVGLADAGPVKASLVAVIEPVSGAAISALWLGTVFSFWDFLGGAFIITMMVVVALTKR